MLIPPAHASELRPCLGEIERQRFAASRCEGVAGQTSRGATHPVSPASAEASLHARWSGSSAVGRAKIGLPDDAGRWLINLEELPSAVQMGQAAVYQLVLDRKVGEYELPEGASLIACGNRESDRVVVHRMPTPLASRFVHLEIKVDPRTGLPGGGERNRARGPVLIVLHHERRQIVHFGVTAHPTAGWVAQQITEAFLWDSAPRYVIRNRDSVYGDLVRARIKAMGLEEVVTAPRSPRQNPFVERMIGSIGWECLDHLIVIDERHRRCILASYFNYYHRSRTHLSLGKDSSLPRPVESAKAGKIIALPQVGGLHHRYERLAA